MDFTPAMMSPEERYLNDPFFHQFVESLVSVLLKADWTYRDIRDGLHLAQKRYETYKTEHLLKNEGGMTF
jgi:hypothetical protein